jgi:hypothetical protein
LLRITHRVREDGNVVHEFLSSFGAKCCVEGDLFAGLDSQAARDEVLLSMAQRRGMYLKDEQLAEFRDNWPALLNPSASAAYAEASRLYKRSAGSSALGSPAAAAGDALPPDHRSAPAIVVDVRSTRNSMKKSLKGSVDKLRKRVAEARLCCVVFLLVF